MGEKYIKGNDVYEKWWGGETKIGTIKDTGWCGGKEFIPTPNLFSGDDPRGKVEINNTTEEVKITTRSSLLSDNTSGFVISKSIFTGQHSTDWDTWSDRKSDANSSSEYGSGNNSTGSVASSSHTESSSISSNSSGGFLFIIVSILIILAIAGTVKLCSYYALNENNKRYTPITKENIFPPQLGNETYKNNDKPKRKDTIDPDMHTNHVPTDAKTVGENAIPKSIQQRNKEELLQQIRKSNNGSESNFRNNPSKGFDTSGL